MTRVARGDGKRGADVAQATSAPVVARRRSVGVTLLRGLPNAVVLVIAVFWGALFLIPFVWMVSSSLKTEAQIYVLPIQWIPNPVQLGNYPEAWNDVPFARYFLNTAVITGANLLGTLLSCSLAAFAFARLRFKGRDALFFITLMTMMLPGQVTLVPQFILFRQLNWINTYLPLVVPAFFGNPFYIFLIRQFMLTIPAELEEAARIDGASSLRIYARIFVPLAAPALVASLIFSFMFHWNDFFGPLVYLNSDQMKTLALGLDAFKGEFTNQWHLLMAGSVMMLIPCLVVFFFAQRYFIEGVVMTGLKE